MPEKIERSGKILYSALAVVAIWAAVYLPSLTVPDFSRNECRRILPAVTMVSSGDWKVPMLSGRPYYRKPPLMNWILAASYKISGTANPLSSRLPTALIILFSAFIFLFMPSGILNAQGRFVSACVFLTSTGMMLHGRGADIDPNYVCMTGLALVFWLDAWSRDLCGWRMWLLPAFPLALGVLLKGPLILLIYYVTVLIFLHNEGKKKELFSIAHAVGLLFTLLPFIIWSVSAGAGRAADVPAESSGMSGVWYHEIMMRFNFQQIRFSKWLSRTAGGIAQFMPWGLAFPLIFNRKVIGNMTEKQKVFAKSAGSAVIFLFILIHGMPLSKARYSLPLLPLISVIVALVLTRIPQNPLLIKYIRKILTVLFTIVAAGGILSFLLFIICRFLPFGNAVGDEKIQALIHAVISVPVYEMLFSFTVVLIFIVLYYRKSANFADSFPLIVSWSIGVTLTFNIFFTYILPLTQASKHQARLVAAEIDSFCGAGEMFLCGTGFVGEEPFTAHLTTNWKMVSRLDQMSGRAGCIIITPKELDFLKQYKKSHGLKEICRKEVSYKSHKYILIRLERSNERK